MASKDKKTLALRIGVLQSGRLIEEFIVKDNKPITLGSTVKSSIIVNNKNIPNKYKLFTSKKGTATLYLSSAMEADISDGVNKKQYKGQSVSIPLTEKDRGKVKVDENIKILFQFIEPLEEYFVPHKIPPQFRNKPIDYLDLKFFIPLMISMILHIVWVVALQTADYEETTLTMDQIPDRFKEVIIQNKPIEEKKKPVEVKSDEKGDKDGEGKKVVKAKEKAVKTTKIEKSSMSKTERKAVAKASIKKKSKMISALHTLKASGGGGGGFGAINDGTGGGGGDDSIASLSDLASGSGSGSGSGYGSGSGDGLGGRGSGAGVTGGTGYSRKGGTGRGGPTSLNPDIGKNRKELSTKKVKKVAIKGKTKIKIKIKGDGKLTQKTATRAIKKAKRKVDGCYQKEAKKNNSFAGRVTILITVGAGGKPSNVEILSARMNDSSLAKSLGRCIKKKLKRVKFPAPANPPINIKFTAAFSAGG